MKIVVAPDSFKESLTADEAARAIAAGVREVYPDADIVCLPMADGGEGTVRAIVSATGGALHTVTATGPLGESIPCVFGMTADGKTAVVEMAEASGLEKIAVGDRNPLRTTSYGTGELLLAALAMRPSRVLLGIGGSATVDGGAGMLQALGARLLDEHGDSIGVGGAALAALHSMDLSTLDPRMKNIELSVACDVDNPLTGPLGAAQVFGPQKGATPEMVRVLDANLAHFAAIMQTAIGRDVAESPGAGAAGGTGAALIGCLNATLRSGVELVAEIVGLEEAVSDADLVITGEGCLDGQTMRGKAPLGVASIAARYGRPVIALAGSLSTDARAVHARGIDAVFSITQRPEPLYDAMRNAAANLQSTARNVVEVFKIGRRGPC